MGIIVTFIMSFILNYVFNLDLTCVLLEEF